MGAPARPSPLNLARRPADSPPPPLTATLHLPHRPLEQAEPVRPDVRYDEQCRTSYWNHECPADGCLTWVPNHLHACAEHRSPQ
jgi:hypothetical protein